MTRLIVASSDAFRRRLPATALAAVSLVSLGFLLAQAPARADEAKDKTVVVTVNGDPITEGDLAVAADDFSEQLGQLPPDRQRGALIDAVVDLKLVAQAAGKAKLGDDPTFKRRMSLLNDRLLRSEYVRKTVAGLVTDAAIKARYDKEIAGMDFPEEVKAAHILVETEDEAKAIIADLKKGGDFAKIAKDKSKDPGSAAQGGDLGYFAKGSMVPEFEAAAFALAPGKITETPVKTQFGFHVIKVEDKRKQPPPDFASVKDQISQLLTSEAYTAELDKLKSAAKIERKDVPAATPAAPAAPAPAVK